MNNLNLVIIRNDKFNPILYLDVDPYWSRISIENRNEFIFEYHNLIGKLFFVDLCQLILRQ